MSLKLYVGNLSSNATEDDLENLFNQVGKVESANIVTDRDTGRSRGFGFVEMGSRAEGEAAISKLNGTEISGRSLTVNEARPKERRGGFGGRSGSGSGSGIFGRSKHTSEQASTPSEPQPRKKRIRGKVERISEPVTTKHTVESQFEDSRSSENVTEHSPAEATQEPCNRDSSVSALYERHSYLVDKKYSQRLSAEETQELAGLKQQIDNENADFYEPIIQRLTAIEERLRTKDQQPTEKE